MNAPRVALIHEWLTDWGGSEAVSAAMAEAITVDRLYALIDFLAPADRQRLGGIDVQTSFLQRLPGMKDRFWYYLWLMPYAVEKFDLRSFDIVLSSSHAFAKGALTSAEQFHVSYVHSPMRYAWDLYHDYLDDYHLGSGFKGALAHAMFHRLRQWDRATANNVDLFLANSQFVARRIWRTYRRSAEVLYPPVDVEQIPFQDNKDDYYLTVSRLVSYKRIDLIVDAFSRMPSRRLVIVGNGPELEKLKSKATPNIEFLGYQPDNVVRHHLANARAFVFAATEDFGITPVEAQAAGTPVIALGKGGALETVVGLMQTAEPTGVFFSDQSAQALSSAIDQFERLPNAISPTACRANAQRFSRSRFTENFRQLVDTRYANWSAGRLEGTR